MDQIGELPVETGDDAALDLTARTRLQLGLYGLDLDREQSARIEHRGGFALAGRRQRA